MVARELCLFTRVDASKASSRDRRHLVELAVKRAAPFPDPDFAVAWEADGQGAVWYWSRSRIHELVAARGGSPASPQLSYVPEALYVLGNDGSQDGLELLQLQDGCCGRSWRGGRLLADRWWPQAPSLEEWQAFSRANGVLGLPQAVPEAVPAPVRASAWSSASRRPPSLGNLASFDAYLSRAALGCALAAGLVASFQIGSIGRSCLDAWRAERAAQSLDAPLKRILAAREAADRNLAAIQRLLALRPAPASSLLLGEATRLLPGRNWSIRRWSQPTPARVEVTVALPSADPSALVTTWEASPLFANVTTDVLGRNGEVTIRADIATAPDPAQP